MNEEISEGKNLSQNEMLTLTDKLEGILYKFVTLHKHWLDERMEEGVKDAKIAKFADKLAEEVSTLGETGDRIQTELVKAIGDALLNIKDRATKDIRADIQDRVRIIVEGLNVSVKNTRDTLKQSQKMVADTSAIRIFGYWFTSILTGLLVGLIIAKLVVPPINVNPLTDKQIYELRLGSMLALAKKKMTQQQLSHLQTLADQQLNEDIKNLNTRLDQAPDNYKVN